jgi:hypothetical protein
MTLQIQGLEQARAALKAIAVEAPKAAARAQNKMIFELWVAAKDQMRKDIAQPTPWSLGALRYKKVGPPKGREPATPDAIVYMDDPFREGEYTGAKEYLGLQIIPGGQASGRRRSEKRLKQLGWMPQDTVWVPAKNQPLNQYGNINGGKIGGMLQNLGAIVGPKKGKGKKVKALYLLMGDEGREWGVFHKEGGRWVPFLWFVKRPTYSNPSYKFHERGASEIAAKYPGIVAAEIAKALEAARQ